MNNFSRDKILAFLVRSVCIVAFLFGVKLDAAEKKTSLDVSISAQENVEEETDSEKLKRKSDLLRSKLESISARITELVVAETVVRSTLVSVRTDILTFNKKGTIKDPDIIALRDRLAELEAEVKIVKDDLDSRIKVLPDYIVLQDACTKGYKDLSASKEQIRVLAKEKSDVAAELWRLNERARIARKKKEKEDRAIKKKALADKVALSAKVTDK